MAFKSFPVVNWEEKHDIVFDIEANGLNPTKVWCVCTHNVATDEKRSFTAKEDFLAYFKANQEARWWAHNGIKYDYPVLQRLWGVPWGKLWEQQGDTIVLSALYQPKRPSHSLASYGEELGFPKGEHTDFTRYSEEMLEYCERDVAVLAATLAHLQKRLAGFSEESIALEHQVAEIIHRQTERGWLLDVPRVQDLLVELVDAKVVAEEQCHETFKPKYVFEKVVTPKYKQNGQMSLVGIKEYGERCLEIVGGPYSRITLTPFNLGSDKQVGERLVAAGWKPVEFTDGGQPKVGEEILAEVEGIPEVSLIADYRTLQKRIGMCEGWLSHVDPDGRIRGRVYTNGARTGRMTHSDPNLAQVTSGSKIYGKEMRQCFIVMPGYRLVGTDADALELCILAHYMADEAYIHAVESGDKNANPPSDAHSKNQRAAGLPTRDAAKTFIYALIYGAGQPKLGVIVGGGAKEGAILKKRFYRNTPALAKLTKKVKDAARRGYIKALDGRKVWVEKGEEYKALNRLLQSGGAIVMKRALVILDEHVRARNLDAHFVGNVHDEFQSEVHEQAVETYSWLSCSSLAAAGKYYGTRCAISGEAKVGMDWSETH